MVPQRHSGHVFKETPVSTSYRSLQSMLILRVAVGGDICMNYRTERASLRGSDWPRSRNTEYVETRRSRNRRMNSSAPSVIAF